MKRFAGFFDILKGAFRARFQPATLTADRSLTLADKSGTVAVMETAAATSTTIQLNGVTLYPTLTVASAITFAVAAGAVAGSVAYVRLVASGNGAHIPAMGPFKRRGDSRAYVNTNGTVNMFEFMFDGVDYWYTVWTENSLAVNTSGVALRGDINWANLLNKPTTLSGYGITDATSLDTAQSITGQKTFTASHPVVISPSTSLNNIVNQTGAPNISCMEVQGGATSAPAFITLHRPGSSAVFFGYDIDNAFAFGGYSWGIGNYAPIKVRQTVTFNPVAVSPFQVVLNTPPANNATGTAGEIRIGTDGGVYICVSANSWRRVMTTTY